MCVCACVFIAQSISSLYHRSHFFYYKSIYIHQYVIYMYIYMCVCVCVCVCVCIYIHTCVLTVHVSLLRKVFRLFLYEYD